MANTSKRGFASMDMSKQREIASKGGRAAHAKGTAHEFTSDEARLAGRKGGEAVSRDRAHMSAIGREGGHSRGRTRQPMPGDTANVNTSTSTSTGSGIDTERQNYIGHASDRESFGESERRMPRQENNNEIRPDNNAGRRTL
jgi:general stress protein YciG